MCWWPTHLLGHTKEDECLFGSQPRPVAIVDKDRVHTYITHRHDCAIHCCQKHQPDMVVVVVVWMSLKCGVASLWCLWYLATERVRGVAVWPSNTALATACDG